MKNLEELKQIKYGARKSLQKRSGEHGIKVFVCMGTCGIAVGAKQTINTLILLPFIAIGNVALALVFAMIMKKNKILGVIIASLVKYFILSNAVGFLVSAPGKIAQMMALPQLFTALIGGGIIMVVYQAFYVISPQLKKKKHKKKNNYNMF